MLKPILTARGGRPSPTVQREGEGAAAGDCIAEWSSPGRRRTRRHGPLRELPAQSPRFLETDRYIAQDRRDPFHSACIVPERQDRELDRDAPSVFSQRRHRQNFAHVLRQAN